MRLLGLIEDGGAPSATELADGLQSLQAMIDGLPALMLGGPWIDVDVTADYTAGEDQRIRLTDPLATVDITLPATIEDTDLETGTRAPRNGARVQIVGMLSGSPYRATYVYSSYLGAWVRIDALTLSSDNPLGPEHDDGLAALLAQRFAPEFSVTASNMVDQMAVRGRAHLDLRLRPNTVTAIGAY